jgi:hypothetical protein
MHYTCALSGLKIVFSIPRYRAYLWIGIDQKAAEWGGSRYVAGEKAGVKTVF